ncbi:hypothetical protein KEM52_004236 [Ascosphaera acerosa]|nr:hypothetical protein KEM52_004236 [Ascosphaera acerosa]
MPCMRGAAPALSFVGRLGRRRATASLTRRPATTTTTTTTTAPLACVSLPTWHSMASAWGLRAMKAPGAAQRMQFSLSPSAPTEAKPNALKYTTDAYPDLQRDPRFSQLTTEHVAQLKKLLGNEDSAVVDGVGPVSAADADDLEPYNRDWMRKYRGHARLVLKPKTTQQVSDVLRYCNEQRLAVVPQGGNTGLVGGGVPVFDEIVVSLARMQAIRSFDANSGVLVADAGVVLEVADNYLRERNHIFPLDLGAKGSCMLGGNVATNAGGLRLLRYGNLHGTVLGLEVVLPDGTIVDDLATLRKNNTGYDLEQLFIGSEGTLGIITGVSVICPQKPQAVNVAYLAIEDYASFLKVFGEAKLQLSEILSAFELMDGRTQQMVQRVAGLTPPLSGENGGSDQFYPFYCLIETSGSNNEHDSAKLEAFLEHVLTEGLVADGVVAQDETQAQTLWRWREGITESLSHLGGTYKYDVSIPLDELYQLVDDTRARFLDSGLMGDGDECPVRDVVGYGHMGDGNLHLNVSVRQYDRRVEALIEPWVYEWIAKRKGSISAEHGIGIAKKEFLRYSKSDTMVSLMRRLKELYDPNGIMNPYKYLPAK